jgi:hypothetical protein
MIVHRRSTLSILGLVASDASYYQEGSRNPGDPLRSLPDSEPRDEHGFPDPLWMSILWHGDPLVGTTSLTTEHGTNGALVDVVESAQWKVARIVEGRELGFGATIYRLGNRSEYLVAMRATDSPDRRDCFQNIGFSVPARDAFRSQLADALFPPLDGELLAAGVVHFTGQSLAGSLSGTSYVRHTMATERSRHVSQQEGNERADREGWAHPV